METEPKGLRKLSVFVTADALLAAVLLVWAQLWIQPFIQMWAEWYKIQDLTAVNDFLDVLVPNITIGLFWTYLAVLLALIGLAWIGLSFINNRNLQETPNIAIGFFLASLIMAILEVGQSVVSIFIKIVFIIQEFDWTISDQPTLGIFHVTTPLPIWLMIILVVTAFVIIALSIWGARWLNNNSKYRNLPWYICIAVIILVIVIVVVTLLAFPIEYPPCLPLID